MWKVTALALHEIVVVPLPELGYARGILFGRLAQQGLVARMTALNSVSALGQAFRLFLFVINDPERVRAGRRRQHPKRQDETARDWRNATVRPPAHTTNYSATPPEPQIPHQPLNRALGSLPTIPNP
jgi:hypothetical protein